MEKDIKLFFKEAFQIGQVDPKGYSPLALAYIGDGVYELMIRTILVSQKDMQVQKYHKKASNLVKAETQANMIHSILEELTEEESAAEKLIEEPVEETEEVETASVQQTVYVIQKGDTLAKICLKYYQMIYLNTMSICLCAVIKR